MGSDAAEARIGSTIAGKYELLRVLGVGGMGAVYEARHRYTDKHVAVKVMHQRLAESRQHVLRFMREAKAASAIGHPAIVDVLDAGEEKDGSLYLVLELLHGEDLGARIERGRLEPDAVAELGAQICDGLALAHDRGIVHRDIKPENVFLCETDDGRALVKILDFGVAKQAGPDAAVTMDGAVLGTPFYMSPEQARGEPVDARADLWSIGAVMFHALAGHPPFTERNYNRLLVQILTQRPPVLSSVREDVPAWLVRVIDYALTPAADRWTSARQLARALRDRNADLAADPWDEEAARSAEVRKRVSPARGTRAPRVTPIPMTPPPRLTDENEATLDAATRVEGPAAPTLATIDPARTTPSVWESDARDAPRRTPMWIAIGVAAAAALAGGGWLALQGATTDAEPPAPAAARPSRSDPAAPAPRVVLPPEREAADPVPPAEPIARAAPDSGPAVTTSPAPRPTRPVRPARTLGPPAEPPAKRDPPPRRGLDPLRSYD